MARVVTWDPANDSQVTQRDLTLDLTFYIFAGIKYLLTTDLSMIIRYFLSVRLEEKPAAVVTSSDRLERMIGWWQRREWALCADSVE